MNKIGVVEKLRIELQRRYPSCSGKFIIDIKHTSEALKISYNTTSTAVKTLVELGILRETTNAARNRVFSYEAYLEILRNGT